MLVFYDGPQLVLLDDGSDYVVVGMATEKAGMDYPLFCAAVLHRYFHSYMIGKVDLRYIYRATPKNRLFFTDISDERLELRLRKATESELADNSVYPEPGIFSSVHTHFLKSQKRNTGSKQKFLIDGTWEARDFSQFHGKMADIYSLLDVAQRLDDGGVTTQEIGYLRESITERPWQGGGSYLSFYGSVRDRVTLRQPLRVAGIEYHSPGYVDLSGEREILDDIINSINSMIEDFKSLIAIYRAIYKALQLDGLLSSGESTNFSGEAAERLVLRLSHSLAEKLGLPNRDAVLSACNGNVAIYAKLVLSYFRRVKGLANFYIEGRVKTG